MFAARARVLFVTPVTPLTRASGSEQRSHLMLQVLRQDFEVDILQLQEGAPSRVERLTADPDFDLVHVQAVLAPHRSPLTRFRPQPDWTARIEQALGRALSDYALVVGRYLWPVCQLAIPRSVPVAVDLDDWRYCVDPIAPRSLRTTAKRVRKGFANWLAARQLPRFERAFVVSDKDARELRGQIDVEVLPNIPAHVPDVVTPVPASRQLLFVGSLWYAPNVEGVDWLLSRVWPLVCARVPDARLLLAGMAPRQVRKAWAQAQGVSAPGFVEDIAAAYAQSCGVLAPMLGGAGSNIKVLEALAHARPCVTTALVHSAFDDHLIAGSHYHVARSAEVFAQMAINLLLHPHDQQALSDAARARVREVFGASRFTSVMRSHLSAYLTVGACG